MWKFVGEVDYYEEGVLSMTLGKILNLPRKWRTQDDELLDQDTTVLVSERVRVFQDGKRVARDALDAANDVRVHGKLLRPVQVARGRGRRAGPDDQGQEGLHHGLASTAVIVSGAPKSWSTGGTAIVPSSCWWFSTIAMIVRPTATAVPFSVCTWRTSPSPGR